MTLYKKNHKLPQILIFLFLFSVLVSGSLNRESLTFSTKNISEPSVAFNSSPLLIETNYMLNVFCISSAFGSGTGTEQDPYVIQDLIINASFGVGLHLKDINANLTVRNCTIYGGDTDSSSYSGMLLANVSNINVYNNTLNNNFLGIAGTGKTGHNYLANNTCSGNKYSGIKFYTQADNNTFSNNTCAGNGESGIYLDISCNNTLIKNYCEDNYRGITSLNSKNNTITQNFCTKNLFNGIYSWNSMHNIISENNFTENGIGLDISGNSNHLSYTTVKFNNFTNNLYGGVYLSDSSNNLFYNNYFSNNSVNNAQEVQEYLSNQWDNGSVGNYWANYYYLHPAATNNGYIWDTPHQIEGAGNGADRYPLYIKSYIDSDGDGLTDEDETPIGTNIYDPDTDDDGLTDKEEVDLGTQPTIADSDGDGINDGQEVTDGSDPNDPNDPINGGNEPGISSFPFGIVTVVLLSSIYLLKRKIEK